MYMESSVAQAYSQTLGCNSGGPQYVTAEHVAQVGIYHVLMAIQDPET